MRYHIDMYEYKKEEGIVDGLFYEIYVPQGLDKRVPAVIVSHGFGDTYRSGQSYAQALAEHGYVVLLFDFHGGSEISRSTGKMTEMTVFSEVDELKAMVNWLKASDFADPENIFLIGASQGGVVSSVAATDPDLGIKGLILLYPAYVMVDDVRKMFPTKDDIPPVYSVMGHAIGRCYGEAIYDYDFYSVIPEYKGPVLLLHGDSDSIVPLSYSERAKAVYTNARLVVIPGGDHGFTDKCLEKAIEEILSFLRKQQAC